MDGPFCGIRCIQGHSLDFVRAWRADRVLGTDDLVSLKVVVHGTFRWCIINILQGGLLLPGGQEGSRNCVHLSPFPADDVRCSSGMRKTNGVDAYVYLKRAHVLENYPLVVSASGAILCEEALPPECIDLVTVLDRKGEEVTVYDSNVAELYPWVLRPAKGVTYSSGNADILLPGQPTVPTLRDLNEEPGGLECPPSTCERWRSRSSQNMQNQKGKLRVGVGSVGAPPLRHHPCPRRHFLSLRRSSNMLHRRAGRNPARWATLKMSGRK